MSNFVHYYTTLRGEESCHKRLCQGSVQGELDGLTVERLAGYFDVRVLPPGALTFVDKKNREVNLYVTILPSSTLKGQVAKREWDVAQGVKNRLDEIEELMSKLSPEEIIQRLTVKDEGDML